MRKLASWTLCAVFLLCLSALPAAAAPMEEGSSPGRAGVTEWVGDWLGRWASWLFAAEGPAPQMPAVSEPPISQSAGDGNEGSGNQDPNG